MTVEEMLADVQVIRSACPLGLGLSGVTHDSRKVEPGFAFVAVRGLKADGLVYAAQAIAAGAAAIVVGRGRFSEAERAAGATAGVIEVDDERFALALMGRNAAGRPDLEVAVTGITGTNGKTTTSYLLASMWEASGTPCGVIGTIEYRFGKEAFPAERTTPEAPEIHRQLRRMRDAGAGACVMEVSSHALDLRRAAGIRFAAAVFTNLTRDHLDYHHDMESYFAAKKRLFEVLAPGAPAVINADDPYGRRLKREALPGAILYGEAEDADFRLLSVEGGVEGSTLRLLAERGDHEIRTPLVGRLNAYNVLAAATAARACGLPWEAIRKGASRTLNVRGRLERVEVGQPFAVLVDYAHTDDALRNVLLVVRSITKGRVLTVFGCGGDRDRTKRPLMGAHAARLSDLAWVTSDNPRSEDPMAIIAQVLEGVRSVEGSERRCRVEPDRTKAIGEAIREARPGDTVLIAGKGHENYQILADRVIHFDDAEVARRFIVDRNGKGQFGGGGEPA